MKTGYTLFFFCLLLVSGAQAQTDTAGHPAQEVYTFVDHMPEAGYNYNEYLLRNIHYPANTHENNIQGKVTVKFVVNEDGHISDCQVIGGGKTVLDKEVLRVVKSFPPWKPGMQNGKPVKVWFTLPIFIDPQ